MSAGVYSNFQTFEGVLSTSPETKSFNLRARRLVITNDSSSISISFKFNSGDDTGTLKPTETISSSVSTKQVILSGNGAPYRVWVFA